MFGRIILGVISAGAACASWSGRPRANDATTVVIVAKHVAPDSIYANVLPPDNPMIPALDAAYHDLEIAMQPHGCTGCHAPELTGRRVRIRHAAQLLDSRRAIEAMVGANLMPPAIEDHPAGIADESARALLLRRAQAFRAVGDAAVSRW